MALNFFDTKECEWSDVSVLIDGAKTAKLRRVRYKKSQKKELLYAQGNEPISIQRTNKSYEGEITLLKGDVDTLNRAAQAAGGDDILDATLQLVVAYRARGQRATQTDTLINVEITDIEKAMGQGDSQMEITLPILFLRIKSA